jgi:hypothetical protein
MGTMHIRVGSLLLKNEEYSQTASRWRRRRRRRTLTTKDATNITDSEIQPQGAPLDRMPVVVVVLVTVVIDLHGMHYTPSEEIIKHCLSLLTELRVVKWEGAAGLVRRLLPMTAMVLMVVGDDVWRGKTEGVGVRLVAVWITMMTNQCKIIRIFRIVMNMNTKAVVMLKSSYNGDREMTALPTAAAEEGGGILQTHTSVARLTVGQVKEVVDTTRRGERVGGRRNRKHTSAMAAVEAVTFTV